MGLPFSPFPSHWLACRSGGDAPSWMQPSKADGATKGKDPGSPAQWNLPALGCLHRGCNVEERQTSVLISPCHLGSLLEQLNPMS